MIPTCKVLCLVLLISATIVQGKENVKDKEKKEERKNAKLPPCAACNSLVKSFQAGMKRTARGKLEGGDTAWEEKTQVTNFYVLYLNIIINAKKCKHIFIHNFDIGRNSKRNLMLTII